MKFIIERCEYEKLVIEANSLEEAHQQAPANVHAIYELGSVKEIVAYGLSNGDFVHRKCWPHYLRKFPRENPPAIMRYLVSGAEFGIFTAGDCCAYCKLKFRTP